MKTPAQIENEIRVVDWEIMDIIFQIETIRYMEFLESRKDYLECADAFDELYFKKEE